jgi:hypothetical protein
MYNKIALSDAIKIVVCFRLDDSPASEIRHRGITQTKAYNSKNTMKV